MATRRFMSSPREIEVSVIDDAVLALGRVGAHLRHSVDVEAHDHRHRAGDLALIQVVLLSRLPFLERLAGFDRLTVWHQPTIEPDALSVNARRGLALSMVPTVLGAWIGVSTGISSRKKNALIHSRCIP